MLAIQKRTPSPSAPNIKNKDFLWLKNNKNILNTWRGKKPQNNSPAPTHTHFGSQRSFRCHYHLGNSHKLQGPSPVPGLSVCPRWTCAWQGCVSVCHTPTHPPALLLSRPLHICNPQASLQFGNISFNYFIIFSIPSFWWILHLGSPGRVLYPSFSISLCLLALYSGK